MRILVLGGDGMLGHAIFNTLRSLYPESEVRATLRRDREAYAQFGLFAPSNSFDLVDVRNLESVADVFGSFHPQVVINAIGIVKQRDAAKENIPCLELNALLPHRLAVLCKAAQSRLVQLSTDCIFSGRKGNYSEDDLSDAEDLYGRSKFLGELHEPHCLTLRTSSVGPELGGSKGLLGWFLAQKGPVKGFHNAIYTGLTSFELAKVVGKLIHDFPEASGLYHLSGDRISKFDLLGMFKAHYKLNTEIIPDYDFRCDRSMDSTRFREQFDYAPPSWSAMVGRL